MSSCCWCRRVVDVVVDVVGAVLKHNFKNFLISHSDAKINSMLKFPEFEKLWNDFVLSSLASITLLLKLCFLLFRLFFIPPNSVPVYFCCGQSGSKRPFKMATSNYRVKLNLFIYGLKSQNSLLDTSRNNLTHFSLIDIVVLNSERER